MGKNRIVWKDNVTQFFELLLSCILQITQSYIKYILSVLTSSKLNSFMLTLMNTYLETLDSKRVLLQML